MKKTKEQLIEELKKSHLKKMEELKKYFEYITQNKDEILNLYDRAFYEVELNAHYTKKAYKTALVNLQCIQILSYHLDEDLVDFSFSLENVFRDLLNKFPEQWSDIYCENEIVDPAYEKLKLNNEITAK